MFNPLTFMFELALDMVNVVNDIHQWLMNPIDLGVLNFDLDLGFAVVDLDIGDAITEILSVVGVTTPYSIIFGGGIFVLLAFTLIKVFKVW